MPGPIDSLLEELRQAAEAMQSDPTIRTGERIAELFLELDNGLCEGEEWPDDWEDSRS